MGEEVEEVDEGAGEAEEGVVGQFPLGDLVGGFADLLLELARVGQRDGEQLLDQEQVEQFLLDFGVHEYFVGHVRQEHCDVDALPEPGLAHDTVDLGQGHDVFAFEALAGADALLIVGAEAALVEVLDHGDEHVLGVVLFELGVGVAPALGRRVFGGGQFRIPRPPPLPSLAAYLFSPGDHRQLGIKSKLKQHS